MHIASGKWKGDKGPLRDTGAGVRVWEELWEVPEIGTGGVTFRKLVWETEEGKPLTCVCVVWPTGTTNTVYPFPIHLLSSDNMLNWNHLAEGFHGLQLRHHDSGCQALVFNTMTYLTEYTFSSEESTGHILAELCCNNYIPSVLFCFPFLYEGKCPTGLRRGLTFPDEL